MGKRREPKLNKRSFALRRLTSKLSGNGRVLLLAAVCLAVLMAAGKLNFALAVNMDGDLLGYVNSRQEYDDMVSRVEQSVSDALGRDWQPALTTYVALATDRSGGEVAERLIAAMPEVREMQVVYVEGRAVCAYESREAAAEALEALAAEYIQDTAESARFLEEIVVAAGTVDARLAENADESLARAVTVETTKQFTACTVLAHPVEAIEDDGLYEDEFYVLTPGTDGSEYMEYRASYRNGAMVSCEETLYRRQEPVTEVRVVGTKAHHSEGNYIWPIDSGWLTSYFGHRNGSIGSSNHQGVDLANDAGTEIHAADGGVVIFSDTYNGYGLLIKIQHENGDVTFYAHNSQNLVKEGDYVSQGEVIALMGCTGVASGNHVHFEIHPGGGEADDPMDYLPECPFPFLDC
ncbi:MAG: peptidoglycan DD-metalloendopeptidase family protein [Oscillospiraceae bacterium]|nr:peptidoglycan DD-metalloendopeptidase family protein [Oscillospiraceae bacterium]